MTAPCHALLLDWIPVRALTADDRPAMLDHLLALTAEDRYLRFGHAVTDEQIAHYIDHIDFASSEVLGIYNRHLRLLAMAHLALEAPGSTEAEFGVSVLTFARGRGYGQRLFDHACLHARNRGVQELVIHALAENAAMLAIARKAGAQVVRAAGEATARLRLAPDGALGRLSQFVDEQAADLNYHLKAGRRRLLSLVDL